MTRKSAVKKERSNTGQTKTAAKKSAVKKKSVKKSAKQNRTNKRGRRQWTETRFETS